MKKINNFFVFLISVFILILVSCKKEPIEYSTIIDPIVYPAYYVGFNEKCEYNDKYLIVNNMFFITDNSDDLSSIGKYYLVIGIDSNLENEEIENEKNIIELGYYTNSYKVQSVSLIYSRFDCETKYIYYEIPSGLNMSYEELLKTKIDTKVINKYQYVSINFSYFNKLYTIDNTTYDGKIILMYYNIA